METEYTTSTGYKIFYSALGIGAIIFAIFIFNLPNKSGSNLILLFPLLILILGIAIIINQFKRKFSISDTSLTYTNIFKSTTILFDQIKGCRIDSKVIYIETNQVGQSKIRINDYASIGDSDSLKDWLTTNFKDLNKEEFEEEKQEILHDPSLAITEEDRERKFSNARKYSVVYSMTGLGLFFASILLHRKMYLLSYILLIYPVIGIILMSVSQGLIRLFAKKNSAYATVFLGLLFPCAALVVQSTVDAKILNYDNLWAPLLTIGFAMLIALYFTGIKKLNQSIAGQVIVALLISGGYAFGSTMQINCVLDRSVPQTFSATVVDHHITHGSKSTTYHLILSEWGQHHESDNISVSEPFYEQTQVGTAVAVYLKKGTFNIPWYYIQQQ